MKSLTVTKLDAAKRQLETAIILFFEDSDPIAIHTLTAAAYDVIENVNTHKGGEPMWVKERYTQLPGRPTRGDFNKLQNFLKHADRDPEESLEFFPIVSEPMLVDACKVYTKLSGASSPMFEVIYRWFHCHGGMEQFSEWPSDKMQLATELLDLFAKGNRMGFFERCFRP